MNIINYDDLAIDEKILYKTYYYDTGKYSDTEFFACRGGKSSLTKKTSPRFFFLASSKKEVIRKVESALDFYDKKNK